MQDTGVPTDNEIFGRMRVQQGTTRSNGSVSATIRDRLIATKETPRERDRADIVGLKRLLEQKPPD
jgi:hypothetical protein